MTIRIIDEGDVNEYEAQGWSVTLYKCYYSHGYPRACFIASRTDL
jgi:hypothetical protein